MLKIATEFPRRPKLWKELLEQSLTQNEINRIVNFEEPEPFDVLGQHVYRDENCSVIRAFLPRADVAWISFGGKKQTRQTMTCLNDSGLYQTVIENQVEDLDYKVGYRDETGYEFESEDPYAFLTEISDYDLYLIGQGTHFGSFEKFGARVCEFNGVWGVHFAVWSPNAKAISVVGDFNFWRSGSHPMTRVHFSGVWGLFVPGLKTGMNYKFSIKTAHGDVRLKSDPYAFASELRPQTASIVADLNRFKWSDGAWLKARAKNDIWHAPVSIYELHLGSWRRDEQLELGFLNYKDLAHQLVKHVKDMGYTHIELLPVMEHPLDESWGYQVVGYFAPSSRFGSPEEFMYFVDHCHRNDIGVILDWVPGHFPKDAHGLADFDGEQIYAYSNWKKGEHKEWGTYVFDYDRNEVKNFLISNALFWCDKYHIDGLRVDAVASMLYLDYGRKDGEWESNQYGGHENLEAVAFLKQFNEVVHDRHPGVLTIAEESTSWPGVSKPTYLGGLGFDMKWNMGWMNDTLEYFAKDPVYRKYEQGMLTFSLVYAFSENFILPISHDEVVYGKCSLLEKMPGDDWQKFANCRLFFGYMFAHPGKKLNFMTNDIGQRQEWNSNASMDWHLLNYDSHKQLALFFKNLHKLYKKHAALYESDFESAGFEWIDFGDSEASVLSWLRWSRDKSEMLLITFNMTPIPRMNYRLGVPLDGYYQEILNSDACEYGGSGIGNYGGFNSDKFKAHSRPYSLNLNLPPLGVNIFKYYKQVPSVKHKRGV